MQIVIDIPDEIYMDIKEEVRTKVNTFEHIPFLHEVISVGTPLPKGHGRIGDLDELEQRISNFVEHDTGITDEYTVIRERFIVDGIRQTQAIIEADKEVNT